MTAKTNEWYYPMIRCVCGELYSDTNLQKHKASGECVPDKSWSWISQ